jgi:hypothetical protein
MSIPARRAAAMIVSPGSKGIRFPSSVKVGIAAGMNDIGRVRQKFAIRIYFPHGRGVNAGARRTETAS